MHAPPRALRVGLIGLGHIGLAIAQAAARAPEEVDLVGALVAGSGRARPASPPCFTTLEALLECHPDVVIECAGQEALRAHGPAVLRAGCDLVPSSLGLFADEAALRECRLAANESGQRIRLSSGAIAGIDGLLGARRLGLESVRYRFVMSPSAWGHAVAPGSGSPGARASETVMYRGSAREAARAYPRHANVTATIALAGLGFERTEVQLVVDSAATDNRHEIEAAGFFGSLSIAVRGKRIAESSPSSRLVAGSLLSAAISGCPILL